VPRGLPTRQERSRPRREVLGLRLGDLHAAERRVFITEGKGGKQRLIPVSSRFFNAVAAYLDAERPPGIRTGRSSWS
jgi:site-specific recombinase XerD